MHALGVLAYIFIVASILQFAENVFADTPDTIYNIIPFLFLFVLSVAVVGVLIFARPAYLFFSSFKREAVEFLLYTLSWMLIIFLIIFFIAIGVQQ